MATAANPEDDEGTRLLDRAGGRSPEVDYTRAWSTRFDELRTEWESMTADERAAEVRRIRTHSTIRC